MSFEKEVEIYTYTLTILNITLKVKFPCRIFLQHQGKAVTSQVHPTTNNKFIFNQEVTLKNQTEKDSIELVVQLLTEKGAKYVGGVTKLIQNELIGSQGQCIVIPIGKCLDLEAFCELRVDQVATSRIHKKGIPKKKVPLRSQYNHDVNLTFSNQRARMNQDGQTKSQYNFPLSINRGKGGERIKDPMVIINPAKKGFRGNQSAILEREPAISLAGGPVLSALQFEVYKEGYNKLKEKYRKEGEIARAEMNKRVALENSENNLKLETMRYKLKAEELEKTLAEKVQKIKVLSETISFLQKKQLDSKYLSEQVQNKSYIIKSLQETIKSLNRDNNELKGLQSKREFNEQDLTQSLKDELQKLKREFQLREGQLSREIKNKNEIISKRQSELHSKAEDFERSRCNNEDLEKTITTKTFEWEKLMQSERNNFKAQKEQLKQKIGSHRAHRLALQGQISQLEQALQQKRGEISKLEYDRKVMTQNSEILLKQNEELKVIKEKHIELSRQHKILIDQKSQVEKNKDRQTKARDIQIEELNEKLRVLTESSKKSVKDLEERLKANQLKLIENESQTESLRNQADKLKRQFESINKELVDTKNQLKQSRVEIKAKEDNILELTTQLTNITNKSNSLQYSTKIEISRLKQQVEKLGRGWSEERLRAKEYGDLISSLQLEASKNKMDSQFREEKAIKELGYSKQKVAALETFKLDSEGQINSLSNVITNLKSNQKSLSEKVQKLELEAIKAKEVHERIKKQVKICQQRLQNSDNNLKSKAKDILDLQLVRQKFQKRTLELEVEIASLKSEVDKEVSEKQRHQKIGDILQKDLLKGKEDLVTLNIVLTNKEAVEISLRDELKKEKEEYTKLDMKLNALKKQFQKFKENLVDNLYTVFTSIPEGLINQSKQLRSAISDKSTVRENSDVLSLMMSLGREAKGNMTRIIEQLKQAIRDNEKINSDYSLSVNKSNTTEFQYSQVIAQVEEEMAEVLDQKSKDQNRYEEEIFLLEGSLKEKESINCELTQQIEELDFLVKTTKNEYQMHRQEAQKKENNKNQLIQELRDQIEYEHSQNKNLEKSLQQFQQKLEAAQAQLQTKKQAIAKLSKDLIEAKQSIEQYQEVTDTLKKESKRANERNEELIMNLIHKNEQLKKCEQSLEEEERKAAELRQFLKGLMKQKEQIIKNELQKSQRVLELETQLQQMKHQNESLEENLRKYKSTEEEQRETIKKQAKHSKDEQAAKLEEKARGNKLADRLKDKEKQVATKDEVIARLEEKLRKETDKKIKDVRELEAELDETHQKLLNVQRQTSAQILLLENLNEKQASQNESLAENLVNTEESLFRQKNLRAQLKQKLSNAQKEIDQCQQTIKELTSKVQALYQEIRVGEQQSFKLQGRINLNEMKSEMKENENKDKLTNLDEDWSSKYYSMQEQYEQRLELLEKQRDFIKEKLTESDRDNKKLVADAKSQENSINSLKKNFQDKIKSLEQDRLSAIALKNLENQRLVDQVRQSFDNLKLKESQCRKLHNDLELAKVNLSKIELKWKENEEKIRNLNRNFQAESQQMRKKEQSFKKLKESVSSQLWKSERQVKRVIQNSTRQIIGVIDEKNTIRVMQISKALEQNILSVIAIKLEDKQL